MTPTTDGEINQEDGGGGLVELDRLLLTVQKELDVMRDNPMGDRAEYVAKLTELERKMEAFHQTMVCRLLMLQ